MKRRTSWKKWALLVVLFLVVTGGITAGIFYHLLRGTPDYYQPQFTSKDDRDSKAGVVEKTLFRIRNWAGHNQAREYNERLAAAGNDSARQAAEIKAAKPHQPFQITFTDAQLTAFFDKWADAQNRREVFDQYVADPRLVVREGHIIIVGKVKDLGLVISAEFDPKLDAHGDLKLTLSKVSGGMLPLPDAMWAGQRKSIEALLERNLPIYQEGAAISADGLANGDAASASMNQLLLSVLHNQPTQPIIFVPTDFEKMSDGVPVRISAISVHDNTIEMTAEELNADERAAVLQRIKSASQP